MPIICLEGSSAVGKTTTARLLTREYGAVHIPEVNHLFERPVSTPPYWFYERQVERYTMAREHSSRNKLVVLDGDVLLPLWYDRFFPRPSFPAYDEVLSFFRNHLSQGAIHWPNKYVFLAADKEQIRKQKLGDTIQQRNNFEKHLEGLHLLEAYFRQLQQTAPNPVVWHATTSPEDNAKVVLEAAKNLEARTNDLEVFNQITNWLHSTKLDW